jgi:hypothetical protein
MSPMSTRTVRRVLGALAVSGVLAAGAMACSDSKDTSTEAKTFCGVEVSVKRVFTLVDLAPAEMTKAAAETKAAFAAAATPPKDISGAYTTVKGAFDAFDTALAKYGYDLEKASADKAVGDAVVKLEDPAVVKAGDDIQAWTTKNCTKK